MALSDVNHAQTSRRRHRALSNPERPVRSIVRGSISIHAAETVYTNRDTRCVYPRDTCVPPVQRKDSLDGEEAVRIHGCEGIDRGTENGECLSSVPPYIIRHERVQLQFKTTNCCSKKKISYIASDSRSFVTIIISHVRNTIHNEKCHKFKNFGSQKFPVGKRARYILFDCLDFS